MKRTREDEEQSLRTGFAPSGGSDRQVFCVHQELLESAPSVQRGTITINDPTIPSLLANDAQGACYEELIRSKYAAKLFTQLDASLKTEGITAVHVFTAFIFESVFEYTSQIARKGSVDLVRTWVHGVLDIGKTVRSRVNPDESYGVLMKCYPFDKTLGCAVGEVRLIANPDTVINIPLKEAYLDPPTALLMDRFLPCGEVEPHHCPLSVRDICQSLLYNNRVELAAKQKRMKAWAFADESTVLAAQCRNGFQVERQGIDRSLPLLVKVSESGSYHTVDCMALTHTILTSHYNKLKTMYLTNGHPEPHFHYRLFSMLTRYHSLAGATSNPEHEAGWQCAIPPRAMKVFQSTMCASVECYASPLNAYMRKFCSAFPDTDVFFGSQGSFYTFEPRSGSYQAGPPYDRQVIGEMFKHMLYLFSKATGPLSFAVTIPFSEKKGAMESLEPVLASPYVAYDNKLSEDQFAYVDGYQHCVPNTHFIIRCPSRLMVLQNEEARTLWPAEPAMKEFIETWRKTE